MKKLKLPGSLKLLLLYALIAGSEAPIYARDDFSSPGFPETFLTFYQDTVLMKNTLMEPTWPAEAPDTNFTYEKYAEFLNRVSDTTKYILKPLNEFRKTIDTGRVVIGLRHDVDNSLIAARRFSYTERNLGVRSTYYILHTADYYLLNSSDKTVHNDSIIPVLKEMQDSGRFEIGWHNDLVTLQAVFHSNPVNFFHKELEWLRNNGIKIYGSSSHGSHYCKQYGYLNFYFFDEFDFPPVGQYINNVTIPQDTISTEILKGKMSSFGLEYEAYFLNNNKYFSDATYIKGKRWHTGMLDLDSLKKGDRVIILLHPVHWHKASTLSEIKSFSIPGQKSCNIDFNRSEINVVMPYGSDLSALRPEYELSPGANASFDGSRGNTNDSPVNFSSPVKLTVFAENRHVQSEWTVSVTIENLL